MFVGCLGINWLLVMNSWSHFAAACWTSPVTPALITHFERSSSNGSAAAASELICLRVSPRLQTWVDFISLAEVWACVTITAILGHCTECWLFQSLCCKAEYSELLWICPLFPHFRSSSEQFDGFDALCFHTGREGTDAVLSLGRLVLDSYRVFMMDVWRVDKVAPV